MGRFFKKAFFITIVLFLMNPTSAGAVMFSYKKGVGGEFDPRIPSSPDLASLLGITWAYDWYPYGVPYPGYFNSRYEHVPMIYKTCDLYDATITSIAHRHPGSYWLIWNEPDFGSTYFSPADAAQYYYNIRKTILAPNADPTAKLIVGGIYNQAFTWLSSFREAYKNLADNTTGAYPVVEGWHVHVYFGASNYKSSDWQGYLNKVRTWMVNNNEGSKELWVTEFGCTNCDNILLKKIMDENIPFMENTSWITRYAWYGLQTLTGLTGSLWDPNSSSLTELGTHYATFGQPLVNVPTLNTPACNCDGSNLNGINLSWADNSSNEDGFKVKRRPLPPVTQYPMEVIATVGPNITGYPDTDVTNGASYRYRVRAYKGNPEIDGSDSNSQEPTCTCSGPTNTPTLSPTLTPTPTSPTPSPTVTLSPTPTLSPCPNGDLGNLDCDSPRLIDETDLSIFLGSWAPFGPVPTIVLGFHTADISPDGGDGKVDSGDLTKLLSNWHP